jgi:nicotinamide-nucleotide amidase
MKPLLDVDLATQWVAPLADALRARAWRIASAESCTGGLIAAACTALAGSSDWFERGFITYSNAAKSEQLGVDALLIAQQGAVSESVVRAMAEGALLRSPADLVVAVTGIAGPGGGSADKPVGLVWLATARRGAATQAERLQLGGDRAAVRAHTVQIAFERLLLRCRET